MAIKPVMRILPSVLILGFASYCSGHNAEHFREVFLRAYSKATCWHRPNCHEEFRKCDRKRPIDFGTYDFVIIGGGTAGAVLARRLSEIQDWKVLLLEAGDEETNAMKIPGFQHLIRNSKSNYGYLTTPQECACFGMKDNRCNIDSGKALGGNSAINGMEYIRGNRDDFKKWRSSVWTYAEMLRYYKKAEKMLAAEVNSHRLFGNYHGKSGPMCVSYPKPIHPIMGYVIKGNQELGCKVTDYNSADQMSVSPLQVYICNSVRQSTYLAYLRPVKGRHNLKILTKAFVTNLISNNKKVTSVNFVCDGKLFNVKVKMEAIVAAGAIKSPQILLLSGIGPRKYLAKYKIPCVCDLPVGVNYIDYPTYKVRIRHNYTMPSFNVDHEIRKFCKGYGRFSLPEGQVVSFIKIGRGKSPDAMIKFSLEAFQTPDIRKLHLNSNRFLDSYLSDTRYSDLVAEITFLNARSRGCVSLRSTDPFDYPNIDPNFFNDPTDIITAGLSVDYVLHLLDTKAFRSIRAYEVPAAISPCESLDRRSNRHCLITYTSTPASSPVGTCKLGRVVDDELYVIGFCNLRVVGSAAIPAGLSGTSTATTVAMAEKLADMIKFRYRRL